MIKGEPMVEESINEALDGKGILGDNVSWEMVRTRLIYERKLYKNQVSIHIP